MFSFLRGRAVDLGEEENDEEELEDEEKKRKVKAAAAERAMQVTSTRAMKFIVEEVGLRGLMGKSHMKVVLRWMRERQKLRLMNDGDLGCGNGGGAGE
ncbi:hypothetical protein LWI28_007475 [Acer negundo]|uniref:Uncharacterized protein n=1 Tax=Acer negundo TaxID=4023 RepID=A0AAD5IG82_ACENE|nr:hypothetical protein LWI28_007475 [Acer negundo]